MVTEASADTEADMEESADMEVVTEASVVTVVLVDMDLAMVVLMAVTAGKNGNY